MYSAGFRRARSGMQNRLPGLEKLIFLLEFRGLEAGLLRGFHYLEFIDITNKLTLICRNVNALNIFMPMWTHKGQGQLRHSAQGLNPRLQVHSGSPSPDLECLRLRLRASRRCLCIKPLTFSTRFRRLAPEFSRLPPSIAVRRLYEGKIWLRILFDFAHARLSALHLTSAKIFPKIGPQL